MTIDQDILKVLQKMEKHLANASNTASTGKGRVAGGKDDNDKKTDDDKKVFKALTKNFDALSESSNRLDNSFIKLNKTILATRARFVGLNKSMRGVSTKNSTQQPNQNSIDPTELINRGITSAVANSSSAINATQQILGRFNVNVTKSSGLIAKTLPHIGKFRLAILPLAGILTGLGRIVDTLVNDTFSMLSKGVGAKSLGGLYIDAARAGMSLQEYSDMMSANMPTVARFKDFDTFGKAVRASNKDLANLGIFGKDAATLSAAMLNTGTTLGVSQKDLQAGAAGQVKVFEALRASTMMTADEFRMLSEEISQTQEVQSLMLGLNQEERMQRSADILKMRTLGQTMGASAAASKALGDALIQQRNLTAQQRFQSAGTVRQAGAIAGMSAGESEELAKLSRKKNLTSEEGARAQQLGAQMTAKLESMMNSGNIQEEFMAEQLKSRLDEAGIGRLLTAAGNVDLSKQSGDVVNKDLGKAANTLEKAAGELLAAANGLAKNPIAMSVATIIGSALAVALGGKLLNSLKSAKLPGLSSRGGKSVDVPSPAKASKGGNLANAPSPAKASKGGNLVNAPSPAKASKGGIMSKVVNSIFDLSPDMFKKGIKSIPVIGMLGGLLVDGIGEAISGNVDAAFNPEGGGVISKIGNTVFASLSGMFGGVADLIDDAIGLFTDKGLNLRNTWDKFAVSMRYGFFNMMASLAESLPFGKDSDFAKSLRASAESANEVYKQLSADSSLTVTEIGKKNKDLKKAQAESAEAVTKIGANLNKVVQSTVGLAGIAAEDAKRIVTAMPSQTASTSTPIKTVEAAKTEEKPSVNSTNAVNNNKTENTTTSTTTQPVNGEVMTNPQLAEIVNLLQTTLEQSLRQTQALETLLRTLKAGSSVDTQTLLSRLSGQL